MSNEYRVYGPPGTGKTTYTTRIIEEACNFYNPEDILVASFTRAAAHELVSRGLPVPRHNVGTLHALCYSLLCQPKIAELHIKEFNAYSPDNAIEDGVSVDLDEPDESIFATDASSTKQLAAYNILRARMVPEEDWPGHIRAFHEIWSRWCFVHGYVDFTGLIETVLRDGAPVPNNCTIGFFDEAQDFTKLELSLVRAWGAQMDRYYLVGDDDQAIYGFKGGDNKGMIQGECGNKEYLNVTYRLPAAILEHSLRFIQQVDDREKKSVTPIKPGGVVERINSSFRQPDQLVQRAWEHVEKGQTVMFLTSCSYMLDQLKLHLYSEGIPWYNPYRKKRGDWNPLRHTAKKGITTVGRVLAYFMNCMDGQWEDQPAIRQARKNFFDGWIPLWSHEEFVAWASLLKSEVFVKRGAKADMDRLSNAFYDLAQRNPVEDFCRKWMKPEIFEALCNDMTAAKMDVYLNNIVGSKQKAFQFPARIVKKRGFMTLKRPPQIVIGTIHSVKGGEADVVFLCPDLSQSACMSYMSDGRDDVIRQFYVGMTRAREVLYLCDPSSGYNINLGA